MRRAEGHALTKKGGIRNWTDKALYKGLDGKSKNKKSYRVTEGKTREQNENVRGTFTT